MWSCKVAVDERPRKAAPVPRAAVDDRRCPGCGPYCRRWRMACSHRHWRGLWRHRCLDHADWGHLSCGCCEHGPDRLARCHVHLAATLCLAGQGWSGSRRLLRKRIGTRHRLLVRLLRAQRWIGRDASGSSCRIGGGGCCRYRHLKAWRASTRHRGRSRCHCCRRLLVAGRQYGSSWLPLVSSPDAEISARPDDDRCSSPRPDDCPTIGPNDDPWAMSTALMNRRSGVVRAHGNETTQSAMSVPPLDDRLLVTVSGISGPAPVVLGRARGAVCVLRPDTVARARTTPFDCDGPRCQRVRPGQVNHHRSKRRPDRRPELRRDRVSEKRRRRHL